MEALLVVLTIISMALLTAVVRLMRANAYLEGRDQAREEIAETLSKFVADITSKLKR